MPIRAPRLVLTLSTVIALAVMVLPGAALPGCAAESVPVASQAASAEAHLPAVSDTEGIRFATFNVEFLFDGLPPEGEANFPWKNDPVAARAHRDRIAAVIRSLDADFVMLQEVEHIGVLESMINESLPDMGYTPVWVEGADTFTRQDVALLSRFPIEAFGRTEERVPVGGTSDTYGVSKNLWVRISIEDRPLTLIGVHFLAQPDNLERASRREAQAEVIRNLVDTEQAEGRLVVVLGDFNDFDPHIPDVKGSQPIARTLPIVQGAGRPQEELLHNVMRFVPQEVRYTNFWDRNRNQVADPGELSAIDHVLMPGELINAIVEVRYVHAFAPGAVSDHWPILVTINPERIRSNPQVK